MRIDPLTERMIDEVELPAGTLIEGAEAALAAASTAGVSTVLVRVRYADGCLGLKRIRTDMLRAAL